MSSINYEQAEVVGVNLTDKNPLNLYSVRFKLVKHKDSSYTDSLVARPADLNIKRVPLLGETILVFKAADQDSMAFNPKGSWYYLPASLNVQNSVHQNAAPNLSLTKPVTNKEASAGNYNQVSAGNVRTGESETATMDSEQQAKLGINFVEKTNIKPMQPFEGDMLIESRFGSSIRFGSTLSKNFNLFSRNPNWLKDDDNSSSEDGDPILIISNGHGTTGFEKTFNKYEVENQNNDASSIWLTKNQKLTTFSPKLVAAKFNKAQTAEEIDTYKDGFNGNQIIIKSGRVVFSSDNETIIFGEGGIGLTANKSITMDTKSNVHINSPKIIIGLDAEEPAVLGNKLQDALNTLIDEIVKISVPTGTGPSGPPVNSGAIISVKRKIANALSGIVSVR